MKKTIFAALAAGSCLLGSIGAQATVFNVTWSGDLNGNSGFATGLFNIDTNVVPDLNGTQNIHNLPDPAFQIISLTVTGTGAGDGTFTEADFQSYYFAAFSPLDYTQELIGQSMANGCTYGSFGSCYGGPSGDFNLFANNPAAPTGSYYFQLTTNGDTLDVTSILPAAVPEPATWAMMLGGMGMIGFAVRRRQTVRVTYA